MELARETMFGPMRIPTPGRCPLRGRSAYLGFDLFLGVGVLDSEVAVPVHLHEPSSRKWGERHVAELSHSLRLVGDRASTRETRRAHGNKREKAEDTG